MKQSKSKQTPGPWPRSTVEYTEPQYRIIRVESSHYMDDDSFYVQDRTGVLTSSWWDLMQDDFNTPFYTLDAALSFIVKARGES